MGSRVRKSRRSLIDKELRPSLQTKTTEEHFDEIHESGI